MLAGGSVWLSVARLRLSLAGQKRVAEEEEGKRWNCQECICFSEYLVSFLKKLLLHDPRFLHGCLSSQVYVAKVFVRAATALAAVFTASYSLRQPLCG